MPTTVPPMLRLNPDGEGVFDPYSDFSQAAHNFQRLADKTFLDSLGAAIGPSGPPGLPGATGAIGWNVTQVAKSCVVTVEHVNGFIKQDTPNPSEVLLRDDLEIPIGATIRVSQHGRGSVTIIAEENVVLLSAGRKLKLAGRYAVATLIKTGKREWYLFGDLV